MSITVSVNPEVDASIAEAPAIHYDINGSQVTYRNYPATSWSNTGVRFSIIPPSMDTYMNRSIMITYPLTITYAGTTTGTNLLDDGYDALRSVVGLRMLQTQGVQINGCSIPCSSMFDTYPDVILHYNGDYRKKHPLGAVDVNQNYENSVGALNNPLSSYANNESFDSASSKRGAYTLQSITRNGTSAVLVYNVIEWVYIPALLGADCAEETGLIRIRSVDLDMNLNLDPKWTVSHATGGASTITSCVVTLSGQPNILCKFISVPRELIPTAELRYPHLRMERFLTQLGGTLAPQAHNIIQSNNIQLPFVPKFVWIFCRDQDSSKTYNSTDTFCNLLNLSVQFNNQSALLSTASTQQLWEMSVNNGLLDSLTAWTGTTTTSGFAQVGAIGSIFCASFGRHISLGDPSLSIGSAGQFNFSVQADVKNCSYTTTMTNPSLYIVVAYDQVMKIMDGGQINFEAPLVPVGEVASGNIIKIPYNTAGLQGMSAGGSAKSFFKGVGKFFKDSKLLSNVIAPLATTALTPFLGPIAPILGNVAQSTLGNLGVGGSNIISGGRAMAGRSLAGGQVASHQVLRNTVRAL